VTSKITDITIYIFLLPSIQNGKEKGNSEKETSSTNQYNGSKEEKIVV